MSKNEEDKIAKPKEDTTNNEDNKTKKKADSNVIPKTESTGSCPVSMTFYVIGFFLVCTYGVYVHDKEAFQTYTKQFSALESLVTFFDAVEKYSPFMEFLEDDDWANKVSIPGEKETGDEIQGQYIKDPSEKVFTKEELKKYDGSKGSPGIFLAILGQVFDVSNAPKFYGPEGGYGFFAGRDASRAYVSGQFDEEGLTDDVTGLSPGDYIGLDEWITFYHKDYKYVGKLAGRYFDANGSPTDYYRQMQQWLNDARNDAQTVENEKQIFPPCNSEWSAERGQRVWCTKKSGGISRNWIGVPRRLFFPGRSERCACVKDSGVSLYNPGSKTNNGDLDNQHLKPYEQCSDPKATSCQLNDGSEE